jgi:hypothetical protein
MAGGVHTAISIGSTLTFIYAAEEIAFQAKGTFFNMDCHVN